MAQIIDDGGVNQAIVRSFANIAASQTASSLVAAQGAGKKIRVIWLSVMAGGTATNVTLNSASSAISELFACAANGGFTRIPNKYGWYETVANEALTITTGAGSTVGVSLAYIVVN